MLYEPRKLPDEHLEHAARRRQEVGRHPEEPHAGFPEAALVQLARVYADAQSRLAEAVHLFHFHVHEGLKATGLSTQEPRHRRKAMRDRLVPAVELLLRYFHRRAMMKAVREDMVLHVTEDPPHPAQGDQHAHLRLAVVFLDISSYTPITDLVRHTDDPARAEYYRSLRGGGNRDAARDLRAAE